MYLSSMASHIDDRALSAGRPPLLWKEPTQERSRARVDAMLRCARRLVIEHGVEGLKMRAVAEQAGVPIGTVYQFFPSRNALLARLIAEHFERLDAALVAQYEHVSTKAEFLEAADGFIEVVYRMVADDPALVEIWTGVQASKEIRHLDRRDSRRLADYLVGVVRPLVDARHSDARLFTACFLICDLMGAAARTALTSPREEGDRLIEELGEMVRAYTLSFFDEDGPQL